MKMTRYADAIKQEEFKAAKLLLAKLEFSNIDDLGEFITEAYARVADMLRYKDFESCKNLTMVGCGPFPMTILHVLHMYPYIKINAIDNDKEALSVAAQVIEKFSFDDNISLIHSDGIKHDYSNADIIYIANLARPKDKILKRIAQFITTGTLVVLRDPTALGKDRAESGLLSIENMFIIDDVGKDSEMFASRDIFLRRK
jgi:hypothetical protein